MLYGIGWRFLLAALASEQIVRIAGVAELVDARGLGPRGESRGGSSPFARTTLPLVQMDRVYRLL
jgi:hypothetical protein